MDRNVSGQAAAVVAHRRIDIDISGRNHVCN
jgi:hypothetical protein